MERLLPFDQKVSDGDHRARDSARPVVSFQQIYFSAQRLTSFNGNTFLWSSNTTTARCQCTHCSFRLILWTAHVYFRIVSGSFLSAFVCPMKLNKCISLQKGRVADNSWVGRVGKLYLPIIQRNRFNLEIRHHQTHQWQTRQTGGMLNPSKRHLWTRRAFLSIPGILYSHTTLDVSV